MIGKTNASGASVEMVELKPLEISRSLAISTSVGFQCAYINDEPMTIWGQGNLVSVDRSFSFYPIRLTGLSLPNRYEVPVTPEILLTAGYGKLKNGSYAVLFGIFDETDSIMGYFGDHNTQFAVTDGSITVTAGSTSFVYSSTPYNSTHSYKVYPMILYQYSW